MTEVIENNLQDGYLGNPLPLNKSTLKVIRTELMKRWVAYSPCKSGECYSVIADGRNFEIIVTDDNEGLGTAMLYECYENMDDAPNSTAKGWCTDISKEYCLFAKRRICNYLEDY
tara:strand:- start:178 stop:522 length:345 start_codon:yes stop_codon:yes gene_type:complete